MKQLLFSSVVLSFLLASCADTCKDVNCLNGGECNDGSCVCPTGFGGEYCEETLEVCYECIKVDYCAHYTYDDNNGSNGSGAICFETAQSRTSEMNNIAASYESLGYSFSYTNADSIIAENQFCNIPADANALVTSLEDDGYTCSEQ